MLPAFTDTWLRVILLGGLVPFAVMRIYWHTRSTRGRPHPQNRERLGFRLVRLLVALPLFALTIVYVISPQRFAFAEMSLPDPVRWLGALLFLGAIAWGFWVNHTLATNFSGMLVIYEGHQLIDTGPYRRIRHPMYTGFITLMVGLLLLTDNWLIGIPPIVIVLIVMFVRTPQEESMLLEHFGERYRAYMARTGRFLPRLGPLPHEGEERWESSSS